jgi:hypothetical protein
MAHEGRGRGFRPPSRPCGLPRSVARAPLGRPPRTAVQQASLPPSPRSAAGSLPGFAARRSARWCHPTGTGDQAARPCFVWAPTPAPPLYDAAAATGPETAVAVSRVGLYCFRPVPRRRPLVRRPGTRRVPLRPARSRSLPPQHSGTTPSPLALRPVGRARTGVVLQPRDPAASPRGSGAGAACRPLWRQPGTLPIPRPTHVRGANPRVANNFFPTFFKIFFFDRMVGCFRR